MEAFDSYVRQVFGMPDIEAAMTEWTYITGSIALTYLVFSP
jgi:hypothetical protein